MFEWVEHTGELALKVVATTELAIYTEAMAAFAQLLDSPATATSPRASHLVSVSAPDRPTLLAEWLNELVYLAEAANFIPERLASCEFDDRTCKALAVGHRGGRASSSKL